MILGNFCASGEVLMGFFAFSQEKSIDRTIQIVYNIFRVEETHTSEYGALAQLVARLNGIQKARGSTPLCSTTSGL